MGTREICRLKEEKYDDSQKGWDFKSFDRKEKGKRERGERGRERGIERG